jgi:hypothetical protein
VTQVLIYAAGFLLWPVVFGALAARLCGLSGFGDVVNTMVHELGGSALK